MNVQAINNITLKIQKQPVLTAEEAPPRTSRTFTPVSYTTADGGLFVGYYLNIHG